MKIFLQILFFNLLLQSAFALEAVIHNNVNQKGRSLIFITNNESTELEIILISLKDKARGFVCLSSFSSGSSTRLKDKEIQCVTRTSFPHLKQNESIVIELNGSFHEISSITVNANWKNIEIIPKQINCIKQYSKELKE